METPPFFDDFVTFSVLQDLFARICEENLVFGEDNELRDL